MAGPRYDYIRDGKLASRWLTVYFSEGTILQQAASAVAQVVSSQPVERTKLGRQRPLSTVLCHRNGYYGLRTNKSHGRRLGADLDELAVIIETAIY